MAYPFPTVRKLAQEIGVSWNSFEATADSTYKAEDLLRDALTRGLKRERILNSDVSLVICGSFARYEMGNGSDFDWTLLVDGVVDNDHAVLAREIDSAIQAAKLTSPGISGTFGNMVFSHDLVHRIGGGVDSNANLTRRILTLLESRPFSLSDADQSEAVWDNVLGNILERYFEEDVHFTPGKRNVPRFLLNDLTRYWRTICVDFAAKHREQEGKKWGIRNAKLRFSRKLIYASGLAFCFGCQLNPPNTTHRGLFGDMADESALPFIERAKSFARTPALEYLGAFIDAFVPDATKRQRISELVFGNYDWWLNILNDKHSRDELNKLGASEAAKCRVFQEVRHHSRDFARGLEMLFFGRDRDEENDPIAKLTTEYIGF